MLPFFLPDCLLPFFMAAFASVVPIWPASPVAAPAPLHQRIDTLIAAGQPGFDRQAAPLASDAEFLRRVCLDLTGIIPTGTETRAFLQDRSPHKREQLIDHLLASPRYARRMADVFDVLLMERRPGKYVPSAQWHEYLRQSFAANKPWDQLVREILSADGADASLRPAAAFCLAREGEPNLLTQDIGRLFLGMNLQCAQCHDHPLIDDYKQDSYYGLLAFFNRTSVFTDPQKQVMLAEKAEGEVSYQSVFDPAKRTKATGPHLPGRPSIPEPRLTKPQAYLVAPEKGRRPVPRFSRRAQLAVLLTRSDNALFRRNSANRLWALLMGRGLVHPVDLDHSANPPSHPQLLALLAEDFANRKYDIRGFLRELVLSQTYQRSSEGPPGSPAPPPERFAVAALKPLSPEALAWSMMQATGTLEAEAKALGRSATEAAVYARLEPNVGPFVRVFGGRPGHPEGTDPPTLDQALFLSNGALLRGWLAPRPGSLMDRLQKLNEPDAVAEELYLSVLARLPLREERREVAFSLKDRGNDRLAALQELTWSLLSSAEFRFNH
jgi:hypothetical protein